MDKEKLLNIIKEAAKSAASEHDVYTVNVLNDILLELEDTSIEENIFIYGDFNGLGKINKEYGEQEGTRCLKSAINKINEILPEGSIAYRLGGDEFLFTYKDEKGKTDIEENIKQINKELVKIEENQGLTIELSGCDIKEDNGLTARKKLEQLKINVEKSKIKRTSKTEKKDKEDKWNKIKTIIDQTMKKYIETFRFEEGYILNGEKAEKRMSLMSEVVKLSLQENQGKKYRGSQKERIYKLAEIKNTKNMRNQTQINNLYRWLIEKEIKDTEEFDIEFLKDIGKSWHKNHISGLYNKTYLEEVMKSDLTENIDEYEFLLFSSVGIKVYNDTIGHTKTDMMMKQCSKIINKHIKTNFKELEENEKEKLYNINQLIDIGAGDYIFLNKKSNNEDVETSEKDINEIENKINLDSHIQVSILKKDGKEYLEYSNLDEFIMSLKAEINNKKRTLKDKMLDSEIAMELFENTMNELNDKYKEMIDDYKNEDNQKKWTQMVFLGILTNICEIKEFDFEKIKDIEEDQIR